jgi:hypothetical protein
MIGAMLANSENHNHLSRLGIGGLIETLISDQTGLAGRFEITQTVTEVKGHGLSIAA